MTLTQKIVHASWLCVAIGLAFLPSGGIDTNLLTGWALVVWTFPFSVVWWSYLHDIALQHMSKPAAQFAGSALVITCAYGFWFVLVPLLWRKARSTRSSGEKPSRASANQ
jgi:hypothetical protein